MQRQNFYFADALLLYPPSPTQKHSYRRTLIATYRPVKGSEEAYI